MLSANHCTIFTFGFVAVTPCCRSVNCHEPTRRSRRGGLYTHRQGSTARRDGFEEIHRSVFTFPAILPTLRNLSEGPRNPLKHKPGRHELTFRTNTRQCFEHISCSLAWRRNLRDL